MSPIFGLFVTDGRRRIETQNTNGCLYVGTIPKKRKDNGDKTPKEQHLKHPCGKTSKPPSLSHMAEIRDLRYKERMSQKESNMCVCTHKIVNTCALYNREF